MKEMLIEGENLNKQGGSVWIGKCEGFSAVGIPFWENFRRKRGIRDYRPYIEVCSKRKRSVVRIYGLRETLRQNR